MAQHLLAAVLIAALKDGSVVYINWSLLGGLKDLTFKATNLRPEVDKKLKVTTGSNL